MKRNKVLSLLVCGSLSLGAASFMSSCATKTATGAAVGTGAGAGVGAGIGALIGGKKGAAIGAAVGAVAGGATGIAIGNYMDKREAELKAQVKNAEIERVGDDLVVRFSSGILFDSGRYGLKSASQSDLSNFAKVLSDNPETNIQVEGHTDSTGSNSANNTLSINRAQSVSSYLSSHGVSLARIKTMGYGEAKPVASNATEMGRQANRRVEVKIIPDAAKIEQMSK